jgi:hypothetical protein
LSIGVWQAIWSFEGVTFWAESIAYQRLSRCCEARMAVELFPPLPDQEEPAQLIDARHRFARKRYANEYLWEPSPEIESAIKEAIFGKDS